jgi:aminoglycoside phosphotransferase (APT) family kinase protein
MIKFDFTHETVAKVAAKVFPSTPVVGLVPLRGGLEASVARLTLRDAANRQRHVVVKRIANGARHEVARYRTLELAGVMPALFGAVEHEDGTWLFLERIRPVSTWPWRDSANTGLVLEQLARIHGFGDEAAHLDDWNYESELRASAADTVAVAGDIATALPELEVRRELRALRRVVALLQEAREQMMNGALGITLIHGDVHTANVMLRTRAAGPEVVFLDWGRSRIGSPLEDVSSWLLSLRSWEPAAARDHDALFRAYLSAAGRPARLTQELRDGYWIAAASNVLAGALRYQLLTAHDSTGKSRATAIAQVRAAFRVIRRADERLPRA